MDYDVIVIGAGTAGLTAAIYGACLGLKMRCIENEIVGGQIVNASGIVNYPLANNMSGANFANAINKQAKDLGVEISLEKIIDIELGGKTKIIKTKNSKYESKAVIIATGAHHKQLECDGEENFKGKGVAYCATCDGRFFRNKVVGVVGGGNTALEDTIYLSNICKEVHLIHRRDSFRAVKRNIEALKQKDNIILHLNSEVIKIEGENTVKQVILKNTKTEDNQKLRLDGLFIAIGLQPQNEEFSQWVDLDKKGYIIADENCKTKTDGVFVAGDTRTKQVRQLVTATADGAVAALMAANYINH